MTHQIALVTLLAFSAVAAEPPLPIVSGDYPFQHRFAEHPSIRSIELTATISGRRIKLVNRQQSDVFPKGVIAEGILLWHAESTQWIIGQNDAAQYAKEVGGCTDGPEVVDLKQRVYWTC